MSGTRNSSTTTSLDPVFDVSGLTAVVTGASSGLGRRFAQILADRGANVVALARREQPLSELADREDGRIRVLRCDVNIEEDVVRALSQTREWFGAIHVLVNNAGITSVQPAEDETTEMFDRVVQVNLVALYRLCHLVGRDMLEQGTGSIVNISSINGLVASWSIPEAGYCASKAGVLGLTRELAAQWADRGVRVNAIAPGYFRTELTEELFTSEAGIRRLRRMPMRRAGNEHELDGALIFLASQASSYVTGQTVVVDGGWTTI